MSLRGKTIKGLVWSGFSQGGRQATQFAVAAILARLLSPGDFGMMAMANIFIDIFTLVGEMGIGSALIQKQDADDVHFSSAFWVNLATGIILTALLLLTSPLIAKFFAKPELQGILVLLSLSFIFSSFSIIQQTLLMKQMEFRKLAIRDIISVLLSGAIGIYMAVSGYGVLSLVGQSMSFTIINAILLWNLSKWRPKWLFSIAHLREIFSFSANLTGSYLVNMFGRNIDKILIGKFLGDYALGIYTIAYKLMLYPLQNVSYVISRVMFPVLSQIQTDKERIRQIYLRMLKTLSIVTFPLMIGLFVLTPEFVYIVFGTKWEASVNVIRILCFCGMIQSISATGGMIILSQNRADLQFKSQVISLTMTIIAILTGIRFEINGVALLYTLQSLLFLHIIFHLIGKIVEIEINNCYLQILYASFYSFMMGIVIFLLKYVMAVSDLYRLCCMITAGVMTYVIILIIAKEIVIGRNGFFLNLFQANRADGNANVPDS
ncbi:MAG TPA: MOP flippase family protein [Geobacteraceae bacterium]|nr:MOP flippase family protein [Geobacteraceae bacterium]